MEDIQIQYTIGEEKYTETISREKFKKNIDERSILQDFYNEDSEKQYIDLDPIPEGVNKFHVKYIFQWLRDEEIDKDILNDPAITSRLLTLCAYLGLMTIYTEIIDFNREGDKNLLSVNKKLQKENDRLEYITYQIKDMICSECNRIYLHEYETYECHYCERDFCISCGRECCHRYSSRGFNDYICCNDCVDICDKHFCSICKTNTIKEDLFICNGCQSYVCKDCIGKRCGNCNKEYCTTCRPSCEKCDIMQCFCGFKTCGDCEIISKICSCYHDGNYFIPNPKCEYCFKTDKELEELLCSIKQKE